MNKKIYLILSGLLGLPASVFAQLQPYAPGAPRVTITGLIQGIETAVWIVFGAIAVISFVVAGVLFLTAQGSPEKIKTARDAFLWGVVGVVVGIIAFSIIAIVGSFIT